MADSIVIEGNLETLVQRVGGKIGFAQDHENYEQPNAESIANWLLEAQEDLVSTLPLDALSSLIESAENEVEFPPGTRIVRVEVNNYPATGISPQQGNVAAREGLFGADEEDPVWWIDNARVDTGFAVRLLYEPSTGSSSASVVKVPTDNQIHLPRHHWPMLVTYATCQAKKVDEDDTGAAADYQAYLQMKRDHGATQAGRLKLEDGKRGDASS